MSESESQSPARVLELASAYQRSQVLFALVGLDVFSRLAAGPQLLEALATIVGVHPLACARLLDSGVALGLLQRDGDCFRNTCDAERFLVRGVPDDLAGVVEHYERMSGSVAWTRFVERLRQWQPAARNEPSAEGEPGYTELVGQHHLSLLAGNALAATLDLSDRRRVLDLGGGTGAMSIALCRKFPALRAIVLEFPGVAAWTREFVAASGCLDRIEVAEGDLTAAEFPAGCDVVLCANLLSLFGAEENRTLLERVFEYLPAGGLVVLSGWMLDRSNHGPLLPLLLSLEDIALGAGDVERSTATYAEWLTRAGFERVEDRTACEPTRVVVGRKPIA